MTDTPPRMNADASEVTVMPSLEALTGTLPLLTGTIGLDCGPVPAPPEAPAPPPEPANASPGIIRTPAPAARSGAT